MWVLAGTMLVSAALVLLSSLRGAQGRRIAPVWSFAAATLPVLTGAAVQGWSHGAVTRVLRSDYMEPAFILRLAFGAMAEESNITLLCALSGGVALVAAAVGATGVCITIDYQRLAFRAGPSWLASVGLSLGWIAYGLITVVSAKAMSVGLSIFVVSLLAQVVVAILAARSTRAAICLPGWHDPEESGRVAGAIVCAALASSLGLLLLDRAVLACIERQVWAAASNAELDVGQRARLLHEWVVSQRTFSLLIFVHALGPFASFVPAIIRAHGRGTSVKSRSAVASFWLLLLVLAAFFGVTGQRYELLREAGRAARIDGVFGGDLPTLPDANRLPRATQNPEIVAESHPAFMAVRTLATRSNGTFVSVLSAVEPDPSSGPERTLTLELVVRSDVPVVPPTMEPEVAALVPVGPPVVRVRVDLPVRSRPPEQAPEGATPREPDVYVVVDRQATVQDVVDRVTSFDHGWEQVHVRVIPQGAPTPLLPKP
jgi:hypothetical protein